MSVAKGLESLGFVFTKDFTLEDHSNGNGIVITWLSKTTRPSDAEIKTATDAWKAEQDRMAYSKTRSIEYPPIGDQLDALWKGGDDAAAMKVIIDKVKSDNPKG